MEELRKATELELDVTSLAFGGRGVARLDGFVIFVEGALPGDKVRAIVTKAKRAYAEARTVELIKPSIGRIAPACDHFGVCGGCTWQTLAYEQQLRFKEMQMRDCLTRIGGLEGFEIDTTLAADPVWRYRNKVEFSFGTADDGTVQLGFHLPGDWRHLVDIADCQLHSQLTNEIRNHIRDYVRASGVPAWDQRSGTGLWRHLVLREGVHTGEVMVNLVTAPGDLPHQKEFVSGMQERFPQITSLVRSTSAAAASVASGLPFEVLAGADHITEQIAGVTLKISPSSFLQTNTSMAERLYARALEYAGLQAGDEAFDLYSGLGSIALLLAGSCSRVTGVEISVDAVTLAHENARLNRVENTRFLAGKARAVLKELVASGESPDLVILDPPRAGASKKEIERIMELKPQRIVYVSCNASTMAANALQLDQGGYRLVLAGAVDMFPHTPHIEVVGRFDRLTAGS